VSVRQEEKHRRLIIVMDSCILDVGHQLTRISLLEGDETQCYGTGRWVWVRTAIPHLIQNLVPAGLVALYGPMPHGGQGDLVVVVPMTI
jgi:hypothetical protein